MGDVLALDLGSSSVRALVLSPDATPSPGPLARRSVELLVGAGGQAELDAHDYLDKVVACIDELHGARLLDDVSDVVVSSQWHSLSAVDGHARPVGPLLTWADSRAVVPALPPDMLLALHARTGTWPHAQYWTGKLPWLLRQVPAAKRFLGLPELVTQHLLDDASASRSIASGTGLLNWSTGTWDDEALNLASAREDMLPQLQDTGWRGRLTQQWRRRWPQLADATWHPPIGDGAAANIGAGCGDPSRINVTIGTSTAVRVVERRAEAAAPPDDLWRYVVDDDRVVSGVAMSAGGASFRWTSQLTGVASAATDDPRLALVPAGSNGVAVLPYHAGSRAPRNVPSGQAAVAGLSLASTKWDVISATMEAVCFEIAEAVEVLEATLGARPEVVACGGALEASNTWQRRLAAVLGLPISVVRVPEASARGAAAVGLGVQPRSHDVDVVAPGESDMEALTAARARYDELRQAHDIPPVVAPHPPLTAAEAEVAFAARVGTVAE